jgi:hypothetical protein
MGIVVLTVYMLVIKRKERALEPIPSTANNKKERGKGRKGRLSRLPKKLFL